MIEWKISCLISIISKTSMDAKISILLLILILIYQYIIYDQNIEAIDKLEVKEKDIIESLNKIILISKIFFVTTLVQILRLILMI